MPFSGQQKDEELITYPKPLHLSRHKTVLAAFNVSILQPSKSVMTMQLNRCINRYVLHRGTHSISQKKLGSWRSAAACCYVAEMKSVRQGLCVQDSAVSGQ